ncbi:rRNA cytosine-C5-methyltransferase [soil metagenome]
MTIPLSPEFISRIKISLGDSSEPFLKSMQEPAPISIRMNPEKKSDLFEKEEKIPWCTEGRYLAERPSFIFDPLFHAGCYYVQEASSMLNEVVLAQLNLLQKNIKALDLCAAPGGKSTHLLSLLGNKSLVVCNEVVPGRNKILQQNLVKWGSSNAIVIQNQPKEIGKLEQLFDLILVDAPCSGEGMFRKDVNAIREWNEQNVERCMIRQTSILEDIIPALQPGGLLIYSTCTYEPGENDFQIEKLIESHDFSLVEIQNPGFGIMSTKFGLQAYPHLVKGEGFYIAVLKKNGQPEIKNHHSRSIAPKHEAYRNYLNDFLEDASAFTPYLIGEMLYAIPNDFYETFQELSDKLYIRQAGICMGTLKGKDLVPSHELALSNQLRNDLPSLDLNREDALRYLKCESIPYNSVPPGWYTITFENFIIGWAKVVTGRINNYFPREWRILKEIPA